MPAPNPIADRVSGTAALRWMASGERKGGPMSGSGDQQVAAAAVREMEVRGLIEGESLAVLTERLAAGTVSVEDWIVLTCQTKQNVEGESEA